MNNSYKVAIMILASLLLLLPLLAACGDDDGTKEPAPTDTTIPTQPNEKITITIGNHTDKTGLASRAMQVVDSALEDLAQYFNEENLIPGVELKVIHYDGQYQPANDIPGYEWLKERGADVIVAGLPSTPVTLKPRADSDKRVIFSMSAFPEISDPPGYVFAMNNDTIDFGPTLLQWIAENDWDYQVKGPAKVGAAGWPGNYWETLWYGTEAYCSSHPDQFEWIGSHMNSFESQWGPEVEALKDADYVMPPGSSLMVFAREYRLAGGTGKFILTDAHVPFLGITKRTATPEFMDGWIFILPSRWYNEDFEVPNLVTEMLDRYHTPGEAEELIETGGAYLTSTNQFWGMMNLIKKCVEDVGPENFSEQALYNTAISFSMEIGGPGQTFSYTDTKRTSWSAIGVYIYSDADETLVRAEPDWLPLVGMDN